MIVCGLPLKKGKLLMKIKSKIAAAFAAVALLSAGAAVTPAVNSLVQSSVISASAEYTNVKVGTVVMSTKFNSNSTETRVFWNKIKNADGYVVYRYDLSKKKWTLAGRVNSADARSFKDTKLSPCTMYGYQVKAFKKVGNKTIYGKCKNVAHAVTRPAAVKITSATSSTREIRINWSKVKCSGYRIYKYSGGKWVVAKTVNNKTNTYKFSNLSQGTTYKYKVAAYYKAQNGKIYGGAQSAERKVTTKANNPVSAHGRLSVKGNHIVDKNGKIFKIKGMSTHGIMWEDYSSVLSYSKLKVLRDDWKINTIRIAMYTAEWGGYCTEGGKYQQQAKAKVMQGVENAKKLGLYVIIDWHILSDSNPQTNQGEAVRFFNEMSKKYKNYTNVIYEICNEPHDGVTWAGQIKPYCNKVVSTIRRNDKKAIIVCGTGTWSQDIDQVLGNRLSDKNCVYTLHFYANTHTDWLRDRLKKCYNKGLPVLVTEFGTCDASGNGGYNEYQTKQWLNLLDKLQIGYVNWSLSDKAETASVFKPNTDLSHIRSGTSQLTASGKLIRSWYRSH